MSARILPSNVRLRPIALPMEHGGWGFLFEPIILGLALAPSGKGWALAVAAIASFLVRQPIKVWWGDYAAEKSLPRTAVAIVIALIYGLVALAGLAMAFIGAFPAAVPLLFAGPLVAGLLWYDLRGRGRNVAPELAAPVALAAVAASIVMLGGWGLPEALAVWALLSLRAVPSVLYVRSRLRVEYGRATNRAVPVAAHVAAIALALWLAQLGLAPLSVLPLYGLLLLRAGAGLSALRRKASAKAVGFSEICWGTVAVVWIALAFRLA